MDIVLNKITKRYKRDKREFTVLDDVSITLPHGKFTVISGDSGVGKSTLLNIVAGLSRPTAGKVYYGEKEITSLGDEDLSELRTGFMGVMTQNCELIPYLTLSENLKLAYDISVKSSEKNSFSEEESSAGATSFAAELLDALGLSHLQNEYPSSLSSGEIKRAAIARTLIARPELVIMDEPTANLDRKNVRAVLKLLRKYSFEGTTVIISSHEKEAIEEADYNFELNFSEN
ncbi:MAG: ATP-binding cassette domain-containing protein [Butyrivibrio sp.]|nr:ATP-binding cassette domain-containing protein [Butyrivibrio sp.]